MKLQISFDTMDLEKALDIASQVKTEADILEVGTSLIYTHGLKAVERFKDAFPEKVILADCKLVDRGREIVSLFAQSGADWITVMAGTSKQIIHSACATANNLNVKIMLDLLDSDSPAQSALEAKNIGADALLFHQPYNKKDSLTFIDTWQMITGNSSLPIYISAKITRDTINYIIPLKPSGIVIGKSITESENPAQEAQFFKKLCSP